MLVLMDNLIILVPRVGLEPTRSFPRRILNEMTIRYCCYKFSSLTI